MEKANVDNLFKNNSYTLSNSTSNLTSTEEIQDNIFKNSSNDIEILDLSSTLEKNKVLNINELNFFFIRKCNIYISRINIVFLI